MGTYRQIKIIFLAIIAMLGSSPAVRADEPCYPDFFRSTLEDLPLISDYDEIRNKVLGRTNISLASWKNPAAVASILSEDELNEVFSELASRPDIPFEVPEDGCYARTTQMARLMEMKGIKSVRFYMRGDLYVPTKNSPTRCYVEWPFHVAPMVLMKTRSGSIREMIIDPSLFDHPVPKEEWIHIATAHSKTAPRLYVRSEYYTGYHELSQIQSERSMRDLQGLTFDEDRLDEYTLIQESRRKKKAAGKFPICFNIK